MTPRSASAGRGVRRGVPQAHPFLRGFVALLLSLMYIVLSSPRMSVLVMDMFAPPPPSHASVSGASTSSGSPKVR